MNKIHYLKGDAVYPQARGNIIITHICNDIGVWGRGVCCSSFCQMDGS